MLQAALSLMYEQGPDALTFASLAKRCGLAGATLVQRFGSKALLRQSALLYDWDRLDEETLIRASAVAKTPEGAVRLLVGLSTLYNEVGSYSNMLRLLREDLRDPVLQKRAAAWQQALCAALNECFAAAPQMPKDAGLLMASQWLGTHMLWNFCPCGKVEDFVEENLSRFVAILLASRPGETPILPDKS